MRARDSLGTHTLPRAALARCVYLAGEAPALFSVAALAALEPEFALRSARSRSSSIISTSFRERIRPL